MEVEFEELQNSNEKTSNFKAWMILFKTHVGISITAMPYAIQETGIPVSIVLFAIVSPILYLLNHEVAKILVEKKGNHNIYSLIEDVLGNKSAKVFKFFLSCCQIGICAGYAVFITLFFRTSFQLLGVYGARPYILLTMLFILAPVCLTRTYRMFGFPSLIANIMVLIVHSTMVLFCIVYLSKHGTTSSFIKEIRKATHFLSIFGIILLEFNAIANISYTYLTLRKPSDIVSIYRSVFISSVIFYLCVGILAPLALDGKIKPIILFTFLDFSKAYDFLLILYALVLAITFPVQLFSALESLESLANLHPKDATLLQNESRNSRIKEFFRMNWIRLTVVLFLFACCILSPNLARWLNINGAFSCSIIQFYFPVQIYNEFYKEEIGKWRIVFNNCAMVLLLSCGMMAVGFSIYEIVT